MMHSFWQWWIFAIILLILEVLVPGTVFLWMAVAAAVIGLLVFLMPALSIPLAWTLFALLSVASLLGWLRMRKQRPSEPPVALNKRGLEYVGRVFTLSEPIVNGRGKLKIGDTLWTLEGDDCIAGSRVEIIGIESGNLKSRCLGPASQPG